MKGSYISIDYAGKRDQTVATVWSLLPVATGGPEVWTCIGEYPHSETFFKNIFREF
jgi:hypothetical protein